jgi:hypothetical protein
MSGANTWRGANTWSVALNENSQSGGGGSSGVQSITAGTNITLGGTATDPIINSTATTGVSSLTAGTGISVSSATGAITVGNTGVLSLTAGTNVSLTGTAQNPIINSTSTGVQSVSAGTNTTITGTATNPIINLSPSPLPAGVSINVNGGNYDFTNVSLLANCILYSSVPIFNSGITLNFPTYAQLVATYGANAVIPFTIGDLFQNTVSPNQPIYLTCINDTNPASVYFNQNNNGSGFVATNPSPSTVNNYVLSRGSLWRCIVVLDSVNASAFYNFQWLTYL